MEKNISWACYDDRSSDEVPTIGGSRYFFWGIVRMQN
jgi:hypothetical protein